MWRVLRLQSDTQILENATCVCVFSPPFVLLFFFFFCKYYAAAFNDKVKYKTKKTGQNHLTHTSIPPWLPNMSSFRVNQVFVSVFCSICICALDIAVNRAWEAEKKKKKKAQSENVTVSVSTTDILWDTKTDM